MTPDDLLARARRALTSARLLLSDGDKDGACNRAYYAMFDAARAALTKAAPDHVPAQSVKTHRGMISAFGHYLVKPGIVPADLGRVLNQVERIRLLADYTGEGIDPAKARWLVEQTAEFVSRMEETVNGDRDGPPSRDGPSSTW